MSNTPLFSILIANYNNGKYLEECLQSCFIQTYQNYEIILVDDCSTDNSKELYQKYINNQRIKIFYNEKNMGCGYTKAKCVELAQGEICGFLDPDDALLEEALESHIKVHIGNPEVSICFSRRYDCDENLNIKNKSRLLILPNNISYLENKDYQPEHFTSFKTSKYKLTKGLDYYPSGVDQDLNFKLEEVGKIYILDKVTYKYRVINNSISHTNSFKCKIYNIIIRRNTCIRRGLNMIEFDKYDIKEIDKITENKNQIHYYKGINEVKNSSTYKIGDFILKPFKLIKKLLKK